jgi:hypothetical protein
VLSFALLSGLSTNFCELLHEERRGGLKKYIEAALVVFRWFRARSCTSLRPIPSWGRQLFLRALNISDS